MDRIKKVLFIINRFAGTGYSPELEDKIIQVSKHYEAEAVLEFTRGPGHATELALSGKERDVDCIVAVGGDGTMNEVARGVADLNIPMAIVPRGSGNGLARHLNIPLSVREAVTNVFTGHILRMDTFTLNGRLSLNVSGIGFDGHIANLFGGRTKRGLAGYARLALKEFVSFREFDAVVAAGDEQMNFTSFVLAIANSSQYGNNACIAPGASVTDGLVNLNIVRKIPLYRFDVVYAFFAKTIDRSPYSKIRTLSEFSISTNNPVPYHVDGEPCGEGSRFDIRVQPAALPLIVPKKSIGC